MCLSLQGVAVELLVSTILDGDDCRSADHVRDYKGRRVAAHVGVCGGRGEEGLAGVSRRGGRGGWAVSSIMILEHVDV